MFALRRFTSAASRTASRPSAFNVTRQTRPQNLAELRSYEAHLSRRWNSTENGFRDDESRRPLTIYRDVPGRGGSRAGVERDPMAMQVPHRNIPPTKVIYVGNLKYETTEKEIEEKFKEFGEVRGVRIPRTNDSGTSRGFAYVEYATLTQAAEAIEAMHQAPFNGRRLNCQYVHRNDLRIKPNPESKTLFIGNLSFNTTDEDLNELFKDVVGCLDVRVAMDRRTSQPRGFIHADFVDIPAAVKAKQKLEGTQLYGRQIRIDFSVHPEDRKKAFEERQQQEPQQQVQQAGVEPESVPETEQVAQEEAQPDADKPLS